MEKITILNLLIKYENWVRKGEIQFLKKDTIEQKEILKKIKPLISDFKEATEKRGSLSENLDWHKTHEKGKDLWKELASRALNDIDQDSKGNLKLFEFLKAAARFEDCLYGLEQYYRDHILHLLWVYLIGEYILRDLLPNIYSNLNWYLFNDIERDKSDYSSKLLREAQKKENKLCESVNKHKDAIWCIMALCHDLGYSLTKLEKLNERVQDVLKYFDLPNFRRIGYSLDIEHQSLVSQFLESMAMEVRIVPSADQKEVLVKCYRDDSTYWRLCRAFEKKQHGILSAYLIYKILGIFADTWVRGSAEEWGLDDDESKDNIIRGDIVFAIAQHTFDFAHLYEINSLADILVLADELEEFSRYGREMLSRKYYDTTAETMICFKPKNPQKGKDVDIEVIYEVYKHLSKKEFRDFFKRKAEQICKFYSLGQEPGKFSNIKSIKMTASQRDEKLYFHMCKDASKNIGFLPDSKSLKKPKGEYRLVCHDDEIFAVVEGREEKSLNDWLR